MKKLFLTKSAKIDSFASAKTASSVETTLIEDNQKATSTKYFYCYKLRLLNHLVNRGFIPCAKLVDIKATKPGYFTWQFERTPELTQCVDEYIESRKQAALEQRQNTLRY